MNRSMDFNSGPSFLRNGPLLEGVFLSRPNRFLTIVRLGEVDVEAHIADPGRLRELLIPGRKVFLVQSSAPYRKTNYDLVLVDLDGTLVSVDSRVPNEIVFDAIKKRFFHEFAGYSVFRREVQYKKSRLDFMLTTEVKGQEDCLIEVKSASLVQNGCALFPDAPTTRGARHLMELAHAISEGYKAYVIFIIQREDARRFAPNKAMDPNFSEALHIAANAGVIPLAYTCHVTLNGIYLKEKVPVVL